VFEQHANDAAVVPMMLAIRYEETGPADVLRFGEVEAPVPGPGEVRVRVRVSGVNPTDYKARSGGSLGRSHPSPFQIPGQDGAGVVDAVGDGVDAGRLGERVWVYFAAWRRRWGTAAQWTVVPAEQAVPLPDGASDELGASLGIPALTAHRCLFADGPIADRTVLVAGGAGAVGHTAIELARWTGAHVVATVSSEEKAQLARAAGAHATVNYRDRDATERVRAAAPDGVDRIVEVALARNLDLDIAVSAPHAVIASYANNGGDVAAVPIRRFMLPNMSLRFVLVYTMPQEALRRAVAEVSDAVQAGALTTLPLHRFPLERAAEAHVALENGAVGKVLIDVP
jgi:NADPH2:quinone reductase